MGEEVVELKVGLGKEGKTKAGRQAGKSTKNSQIILNMYLRVPEVPPHVC